MRLRRQLIKAMSKCPCIHYVDVEVMVRLTMIDRRGYDQIASAIFGV